MEARSKGGLKNMNREQFIEALERCEFEEFPDKRFGHKATFVVKDDNGKHWMIDRVHYDPDNIVPEAIYDINDCKRVPVKVKPIFGIVGYVEDDDDKTCS